jgi:tetratricopeptide (TPR) repeat protein
MFSLAVNYAISGLDAWSYHLFNIAFHLINCLLVFRLAMLLSNKNVVIAFTTAVLFGVHPMHVESVAWISERKDVLYTLFFTAGLISYTKYADTNSKKQFGLTVLFLILSLLSKPAAVVFPLVLFCIDLLRKRKLSLKLFIEKIPFAVPALVSAILTYNAQTDAGSTGAALFDTGTRLLMAFYGIMMYIVKLFIPYGQSSFYPFPPSNASLPVAYYIAPVFFVLLAIVFYRSLKSNRVLAFGISFYLANLILVLQILPVGSAVISERYTYVPYIGLFYSLGWLIDRFAANNRKKAFSVIIPVSFLFAILAYNQAGVWHDGATMWDHAIQTNPSAKAYRARAAMFRDDKEYNNAVEYYSKALELDVADYESYCDRGTIFMDLKEYNRAYSDYRSSIAIKPSHHVALENMGALHAILQNNDSALYYFGQTIKIKPDYKNAYKNRGVTYMQMKRHNDAIKDFETYIIYQPGDAEIYNTIGLCYRVQSKFQESIEPINKAINMDPRPPFFMNRSYAYFGLNNIEQARKDALAARQGGINIDPAYARSIGLE